MTLPVVVTVSTKGAFELHFIRFKENEMGRNIFYIIGVVVVIVAILSFVGIA